MNNDSANTPDFGIGTDWLTLNMNGLFDPSGVGNDGFPWYGAYGPETQNNIEVLGKLSNNGRYPGAEGYGDGSMNF